MKTRQDNYMTVHIGAVKVEIKIELLWPIKWDVAYHEKQIEQ